MGGILHILKIPFTGLFIGGSAVIFITLLAHFSDSRKVIFKSTLKVILVKFVVSPYSPINAYFAVLLQSLLGWLLFYRGFNKISPVVLGFFSTLFSGFQKIFILTLVFGMTFWESIDIFFQFIVEQLLPNSQSFDQISLSYAIIGLYITLHLIGGLIAGIYASKLPARLLMHNDEKINVMSNNISDFVNSIPTKKKRKKWWNKPSSIALLVFFLLLIVISLLFDQVENNLATNVLTMLLRSILIIVIWYYFISPLLLKFINKYLTKKKKRHAKEIETIVQIFPHIKSIIKYSWNETREIRGIKRLFIFFDNVLIHYLLFESGNNE
ncbi:MAG: hypothetical protein H6609_20635 [Ignavibacteriales bacterium]|nr:hypothetical protein [Ignavibacteriales bacterium]